MPTTTRDTTRLDREVRADDSSRDAFRTMVGRLSRLSVDKHFDAYVDIDWDDPDTQVDPTDPRWAALAVDPLRATDWYQGLTDGAAGHASGSTAGPRR